MPTSQEENEKKNKVSGTSDLDELAKGITGTPDKKAETATNPNQDVSRIQTKEIHTNTQDAMSLLTTDIVNNNSEWTSDKQKPNPPTPEKTPWTTTPKEGEPTWDQTPWETGEKEPSTREQFTTWLGEQKDAVCDKEKWKTETWKNILRCAWGIGAGVLVWKGIKGLRNRAFGKKKDKDEDDKKEETEKKESDDHEKSFWDKPFGKFLKWTWAVLWVGSWVYYVAHGLYTGNWEMNDIFDRTKGKKLTFEQALGYCKGIQNQDDKDSMSYGLDLKYDETRGVISAYGQEIKINKETRSIEELWIKFKTYDSMISTAILIAYLRKTYKGRCKNNNPFWLNGEFQWDINVNTGEGKEEAVDGTWNGGKIVGTAIGWIAGIAAGVFGWWPKTWLVVGSSAMITGYLAGKSFDESNVMAQFMPEIDNPNGKAILAGYLNNLGGRETGNQTEEDITESPIKKEIVECMNTIQDNHPELVERGYERKLDAIQDPKNPNKYTIKAYDREFEAEVKGEEGKRTIKILGITGWNPSFNIDKTGKENLSWLELPLKEGIYMTILLWYLLNKYHHRANQSPRFEYKTTLGLYKGIYFSDKWRDTRVFTEDSLQSEMPSIFSDENEAKRTIFMEFLNGIKTDTGNKSYWKDPTIND